MKGLFMRTQNSIKNIITVIVPYFIIGFLGFIKSRVFVTSFNDDIYSLNQLFFQILGYFSLAEAGFETFIMQKYYKAFSNNDKEEINHIFSTSVLHFRYIGIGMLAAGSIMMFFVHFFTKAQVDGNYLKLIFLVFVIKNSVEYFLMCPRIVINSDQKAFKTNLYVNVCRIAENLSDIILALLGTDYLILLIPGIGIRIIFNLIINKKVYKEYPWLSRIGHKYYYEYIKGMSNLIYQRIAGILNSNTDIILISTFVDPLSVIIYTSYNYITKFINDTLCVMANSLTPSFANAFNEGDIKKSFHIFDEMSSSFFFIASFFATVLFLVFDPFVSLWMGGKYVINKIGLILMVFIMFDQVNRRMMAIAVNALGLYYETKICVIAEAIVNFLLSVILVQFIGLNGVLIGTALAVLTTSGWYTPYYIYRKVFNKSPSIFVKDYLFSFICAIVLILIQSTLLPLQMNSFLSWILSSTVYSIISGTVLFAAFFATSPSFRRITTRLLVYVKTLMNRKGKV